MKKGILFLLAVLFATGMVFAGGASENGDQNGMPGYGFGGGMRGHHFMMGPGAMADGSVIEEPKGIVVQGVLKDSPAEKAGLVRGDVIQKVDGTEVSNLSDLYTLLDEKKAGQELQLEVLHGSAQEFLTLTIETRLNKPLLGIVAGPGGGFWGAGMYGGPMGFFGGPFGQAVMIHSVKDGGPASQAGLVANDIITEVNGKTVNPFNLVEVIQSFKPGDSVELSYIPYAELKDMDFDPGNIDKLQQSIKEKVKKVSVTLGEADGKAYLGIEFGRRMGPGFFHDGFQGRGRWNNGGYGPNMGMGLQQGRQNDAPAPVQGPTI